MPTSTVLIVPSKSRNTDVRVKSRGSRSSRAIPAKLAVIHAPTGSE